MTTEKMKSCVVHLNETNAIRNNMVIFFNFMVVNFVANDLNKDNTIMLIWMTMLELLYIIV